MSAPNEIKPVRSRLEGLARSYTAGSTKGRRIMEGDGAAAARADGNSSARPEPSI
jgi:hypothetical protein